MRWFLFLWMTAVKLFKYHKPVGVLSTTFLNVPGNIIEKGNLNPKNKLLLKNGTPHGPIIPVGRLDKDSSGLLLLTNSEGLVARLLRTFDDDISYGSKFAKVYEVTTSRRLSDEQMEELRSGVVISTMARNKSGVKNVRPTLPIQLERFPEVDLTKPHGCDKLLFTLREGRNRQIRKMIGKYGNAVLELKRISFGGITLENIENPGEMQPLSDSELALLGIKKLL